MTQELGKLNAALTGRKIVVINLAAFSMTVGMVEAVTVNATLMKIAVNPESGGPQVDYTLEAPVKVAATPTGFRFESEKMVLQVDFMPD
ncbi:MAG: hypothetical protein WCS37_02055 [Chloroflexota bacterium]|nr:hypothetical protein [Chloroflexota bacterium]